MESGTPSIIQICIGMLVGILFVASYFLADKHFVFEWLAYFPWKRKGSKKIGGLIFGSAFILISAFWFLALYF